MERQWTPDSRVTITDAGMVIEVKLRSLLKANVVITFEPGPAMPGQPAATAFWRLCLSGQDEDHGPFVLRFDLPPGHSPAKAKAAFANGTLRIELPPGPAPFPDKPRAMLIYCSGCGKHFDIVITGKGSRDYCCPNCGKVQAFDLDALVQQAIEQGRKMLGKKRWRR